MQDRWWKSRCLRARFAVCFLQPIFQLSKKSLWPSLWLRFLYLHTSDVHQHRFNRSRVTTSLQDTDSRSWSTKLARIKHVDLIQVLSDWLTYAADNAKARIPIRVWKMFGFYFIKRLWNAKATNLRYVSPTLSIQNVKMAVYLRKWSHNRFSPRLWSEVNNTCRRSLTQRSASWSTPVAPKVWVETEITVAKCQKWAMSRRSNAQTILRTATLAILA